MATHADSDSLPASPVAGDGDNFAATYASARMKFMDAALEVPGCTLHSFRTGGATVKHTLGVDAENLFVDFAVVRGINEESPSDSPPVAPRHMIVHCCGVQGVDGFVGSGAQVALLHSLASDKDSQRSQMQPDDCIVFIHAVNPFGFSWARLSNRTRRGVDLSRNFVAIPGSTMEDTAKFEELKARHNGEYQEEAATSYKVCCGMLNRSQKPDRLNLTKQAYLHGQYSDPRGMCYGGSHHRQETKIVMDVLWDLGVRPDNAALESLAFVQVTAGGGDKHIKERIVCPNEPMQINLHNLGIGQLADASVSALEDLEEDLQEAWGACFGAGKADEATDLGPQARSAERHTFVFVANTREHPASLQGSLLDAVMQLAPQPPKDALPPKVLPANQEPPSEVRLDSTMACELTSLHIGAPQPLQGSDEAPRRVGAGRWTSTPLPEGAGCKRLFVAQQQFTTCNQEELFKAMEAEHRAAEKDAALPLYAEERMDLRDCLFEDNMKLRKQVTQRSWRLFTSLAGNVFRDAPAAPQPDTAAPAEGDDAVAAEGDGAVAAEGDDAVAVEGDDAVAVEGDDARD